MSLSNSNGVFLSKQFRNIASPARRGSLNQAGELRWLNVKTEEILSGRIAFPPIEL
jgi:hypothetical protein